MRALRFGRELSEILEIDRSVAPLMRDIAKKALTVYPTSQRWVDFLKQPDMPVPLELACAMHMVRELLVDSAISRDKQDEWCDAVRRTLRHFPSAFEIDAWCVPDTGDDIRRHIADESHWDHCVDSAFGLVRTCAVDPRS
ncbi:hypothetical protein RD110_01115 [Rhodoferax koreense]|uniref:Uncharacterized protein n=1 Tax=Rhodoferax koreensis TaxID=1842727 RepID=A0A1P8JQG2_9BURK|nr:hypothetical protein RD110_01115 [Rhodoferax koreense]